MNPYQQVERTVREFDLRPSGMSIQGATDHLISERARRSGRPFDQPMADDLDRTVRRLMNADPPLGVAKVVELAVIPPKTFDRVDHSVECVGVCGRSWVVPSQVAAVICRECATDTVVGGLLMRATSPGPEPAGEGG